MGLTGRRALVTGATAGIGKATVEQLLAAGAAQVYALGRRVDRLEALCKGWNEDHDGQAVPVVMDITDTDRLARWANRDHAMFDVDILVNNAGLARGVDPMQGAELDDWDTMIATNITGLLHVTRHVLERMRRPRPGRAPGHIVMLGSVAGRWVYPGGGVYCATKHAVRALTEGLRLDLAGSGVRVTNIEPGLVETEFSMVRFGGDASRADAVYADMRVLTSTDVAQTIIWTLQRPAHVNVQELVLYPTDQASIRDVHRS